MSTSRLYIITLLIFTYTQSTLWEIDGETVEAVSDYIFLGSKITADGDCSHEIKRCLLLWRKVMTNKDSLLKSRDNTFPTKVRLVNAMVFPVVMYGCESWSGRKLSTEKLMLLNCGVGEDSWESLGLQEIQRGHLKGHQSWEFIGRTYAEAELQYFGHFLWSVDSLEKTLMLIRVGGRRRKGRQRMRWLDGITDLMDKVWVNSGSLCWTGRPGVLQFTSSQRVRHDWVTELNWTGSHHT